MTRSCTHGGTGVLVKVSRCQRIHVCRAGPAVTCTCKYKYYASAPNGASLRLYLASSSSDTGIPY